MPADEKANHQLRQKLIRTYEQKAKTSLIRKSSSKYFDTQNQTALCLLVSKIYQRRHRIYWYAFHCVQVNYLKNAERGYLFLGCLDRTVAYLIPISEMEKYFEKLNITKRSEEEYYYHINMKEVSSKLAIHFTMTGETLDLSKFEVELVHT